MWRLRLCKVLKVQSHLRSESGVYKRRDCEGDSGVGVVALYVVMLRLPSGCDLTEIMAEIGHRLRFC